MEAYSINLDNPVEFEWKGNSTLGEVQYTTGGEVEKILTKKNNNEIVMDPETIDSLYGKKKDILDYLKKNCMTPKEGKEVEHVKEYGVEGVRYSLTLPSVNGFRCKKIKWFVSDKEFYKYEWEKNRLEENGIWKSNSCEVEQILIDILGNMRDFLECLGVPKDVANMNLAESVEKVTGLNDTYWLKDANVLQDEDKKRRHLQATWNGYRDSCDFDPRVQDTRMKLLLGLSVS